jgi:electron transport complex protein RnfD
MLHVIIALLPASVFGVALYGLPALAAILVSVAAASAGEALFRAVTRQENRTKDLSAVITGLLLALIVPPSTPLWMLALGSLFAVVVAKEFFGGLGSNVFNPALSGRAFLIMSFPPALVNWTMPFVDAVSAATPLGIAPGAAREHIAAVGRSLFEAGLSHSGGYWDTIRTLLVGSRAGSTGESSIICILAGFIYLLVFKVIDWRAPCAMIASAFVLTFLLGGDPLFGILSGGIVFGAVFMATDYTSAPLTAKGKLVFGCGAGIITVLIRKWGSFPEGVTYGILMMNAVTPFLNRLLQKKYGAPKKTKAVSAGAKEQAK